jgi:hypothetical protein
MPRMTYRVIPQTGARYSVEMVSRTGKRSLVEVFRDQAASGRMDRANCAYADLIQGIRYRPATGRALMHLQPTAGGPVHLGSVGPKGGSAMLVSRSHRDEGPG